MLLPSPRRAIVSLLAVVLATCASRPAAASDHADPVDPLMLRRVDGTLTGLFVFPTRDRMRSVTNASTGERRRLIDPRQGNGLALILCAHRSLATDPPYAGLDEYTFRIFLDFQSELRIDYPANGPASTPDQMATLRYGGVVANPEKIKETAVITMRLDPHLNFLERKAVFVGKDGEKTIDVAANDWYAGVRDDPFIFPMFFGTNVVAMALVIPYDLLPAGRDDFLVWATSERHKAQIDIVGRSQRTQLPRFDFLNTLHPSEHVAAILEARDNPGVMQDVSTFLLPNVFRFRAFDLQPDVLFFSRRFPAGYPNGRCLEDDVARLACLQGDCQLYELSFNKPVFPDSEKLSRYTGGRPTANDKAFQNVFPYLADPWAPAHPTPPPSLMMRTRVVLAVLALLVVLAVLLPWFLYFWILRRLRILARQYRERALQPAGGGA